MSGPTARRLVAGDGPQLRNAKLFPDAKAFQCSKDASFIKKRLQVWDKVYAKHQAAEAAKPRKDITIELPDGKQLPGKSFETTPLSIATGISKKLAEAVCVAKVYYKEAVASDVVAADEEIETDEENSDDEEEEKESFVLWDLSRPLEGSCKIELLKFDDIQGSEAFWHSSSHLLGWAIEQEYGAHLTIGPSTSKGFYYDAFFGEKKMSTVDDLPKLEAKIGEIVKKNEPFIRCAITKEDALEMFGDNPFKVQLITNKVPDGAMTSAYRCGDLIDLCRGPHLPTSGRAKTFWINKNSASFWLGKDTNDSLQRIYGISFPSDKEMKEHKRQLEEAAKRDHREIGKKQELYFFSDYSAGSCFWMPHGARIYNRLVEFMRREYAIRGFHEVITPNLYHESLFKASGHYYKYKDDMYNMDIEGEKWFLKPMNCPGHCVVFSHRVRSYKELPFRMASFGVLHRNEKSGSLSGLTRVRRFQQDDAHIFCRMDQIRDEIRSALAFVKFMYDTIGLDFKMKLSTRPKKAIGSKEVWNNAEKQLEAALNESGKEWTWNKGDGAFYGPKIDFKVKDAIGREHQCATIQLDFCLPMRFNLQYRTKENEDAAANEAEAAKAAAEQEKGQKAEKGEKGAAKKDANKKKGAAAVAAPAEGAEPSSGSSAPAAPVDDAALKAAKEKKMEAQGLEGTLKPGHERPVMVHRAILGSVERFTGILCEHYGGKWPFFISPRQVMVVPTHAGLNSYCEWVAEQYRNFGLFADADISSKTMNKKVREAQLEQYNYIAICGEKEQGKLSVDLRDRDLGRSIGMFTVTKSVEMFLAKTFPNSKPANVFDSFEGQTPESVGGAAAPAPTAVEDKKVASGPSSSEEGGASSSSVAEKSGKQNAAPAKNGGKQNINVNAGAGGNNKGNAQAKNGNAAPAKASSSGSSAASLPPAPGGKSWESHFAEFPYVDGYVCGAADRDLSTKFNAESAKSLGVNTERWFSHVQNLVQSNSI